MGVSTQSTWQRTELLHWRLSYRLSLRVGNWLLLAQGQEEQKGQKRQGQTKEGQKMQGQHKIRGQKRQGQKRQGQNRQGQKTQGQRRKRRIQKVSVLMYG